MRAAGGIGLWLMATLIGASAAVWFALAGLDWSGEFTKRPYWEDSESEIGVGLGVIALVVWIVLLAFSAAVLRRGSLQKSRGSHISSVLLVIVSIAVVAGLSVLAIGWPELPSEVPSPPWNRA